MYGSCKSKLFLLPLRFYNVRILFASCVFLFLSFLCVVVHFHLKIFKRNAFQCKQKNKTNSRREKKMCSHSSLVCRFDLLFVFDESESQIINVLRWILLHSLLAQFLRWNWSKRPFVRMRLEFRRFFFLPFFLCKLFSIFCFSTLFTFIYPEVW